MKLLVLLLLFIVIQVAFAWEKCETTELVQSIGNYHLTKRLLRIGADPNTLDCMGRSDFNEAVLMKHWYKHPDDHMNTIKIMLEYGADASHLGEYMLEQVSYRTYPRELYQLLLDYGAGNDPRRHNFKDGAYSDNTL